AEVDAALRVGRELAAQVHVGLRRILIFVETLGRGLPDVDLDALDRRATDIVVQGIAEQRRPRRRRSHDRAAVLRARRFHAPERAELAGVGFGLSAIAVVEETYQRRQAEGPGHQDRLIVALVG